MRKPGRAGRLEAPPAQIPPAVSDRIVALAEAAGVSVSRETWMRLEAHLALLAEWQAAQNLVAPATLPDAWERHVLDSAQLLPLVPGARRFLDIGSGAGFPGLTIAILLSQVPGVRVHLVESNARKVAFLRAVAARTGAPATIHPDRIEAVAPMLAGAVEVITARAVADLDRLLAWSAPLIAAGAVAVFHKGASHAREIDAASHAAGHCVIPHDSITAPGARLIEIRRPAPNGT